MRLASRSSDEELESSLKLFGVLLLAVAATVRLVLVRKDGKTGICSTRRYGGPRGNRDVAVQFLENAADGGVMSPLQEVCNAMTMVPPALACAAWAIQGGKVPVVSHLEVWSIVAGTATLFPFSALYHLRCAARLDAERVEGNVWRILDQSAQLVAAVLFSYGLSGGSVSFATYMIAVTLPFQANLWGLSWVPSRFDAPIFRRGSISASYLLCTAPMLLRGDVSNYLSAIGSISAGSLFFVFNRKLQLWGHIIFHLWLTPFVYFLLQSAMHRE